MRALITSGKSSCACKCTFRCRAAQVHNPPLSVFRVAHVSNQRKALRHHMANIRITAVHHQLHAVGRPPGRYNQPHIAAVFEMGNVVTFSSFRRVAAARYPAYHLLGPVSAAPAGHYLTQLPASQTHGAIKSSSLSPARNDFSPATPFTAPGWAGQQRLDRRCFKIIGRRRRLSRQSC